MSKPTGERGAKNAAAQELGRRGGLKGGRARAAKLSQSERSAIAKKAAEARWGRRAAQSEIIGGLTALERSLLGLMGDGAEFGWVAESWDADESLVGAVLVTANLDDHDMTMTEWRAFAAMRRRVLFSEWSPDVECPPTEWTDRYWSPNDAAWAAMGTP